ncbi:GntR family transcriptional regulator [Streptomyces sp. NPDC049040]|uniref:GntR family transcriptional regulator n=1 Tax=Streptomyces sp. NPDC049040 TaxID=3365593 RepID=UPI00371F5197
MSEIARPEALYRQVAAAIRDAIVSGAYPPGSPLPSEAELIRRYQVSRPTVRNAVAALRAEGLLEVIHGTGSFVRRVASPVLTIDRSAGHIDAGAMTAASPAGWEEVEEPHIHRTHTDAVTGPLLGLGEDEALLGVDRLLADDATATRVLHQTLMPITTAEGTELADHPGTWPTRIHAVLAEAGHPLWWSETVRARMPLPDERAALRLQDGIPLLETTRVTHGTDDRPLVLEVLRTNANRAQLAYRLAP